MFPSNTLCDGGASGDEEDGPVMAALQRSPTFYRARTAVCRNTAGELALVDVGRIGSDEQKQVLDKLIAAVSDDMEGILRRVRQRFGVVGLEFPKVEVRFENLKVDALVHVGSRALPTIRNFIFDMTEAFLRQLRIFSGGRRKLPILNSVNVIIRPSRLTLLLGPPSSGKTTFLLALAGRLAPSLQLFNSLPLVQLFTYGNELDNTLENLKELLVFGGDAGFPYPVNPPLLCALPCLMSGKVTYNGHSLEVFTPLRTSAYASQQDLHISEMTVREVLEFAGSCQGAGFKHGMHTCADTLVGDEMLKGISGGQKKPAYNGVLFLDEISTGPDSSTTHQIINYLRHTTHALDGTTLVSLLQPDPETYKMFDDCPSMKNVADFLQEVLSEKDREHSLAQELAVTFDKNYSHPSALSTKTYGISRAKLLRTSLSWQMLLLKQNSPVFIFKLIQLLLIILMMMSVFFRTTLHHNTVNDGGIYLGALYFAIVVILFNGFMEVPMLIAKLPVLYKQRDLRFYPFTYYAIGFDPQIRRCIFQFLLYFTLHQMSIGLFRVMASLGRNMVVANTFGSFAMLVVMVLGGFILSRASVNEFLGHYWDKSNSFFPDARKLEKALISLGNQQAVISREDCHDKVKGKERKSNEKQRGIVLPFKPLSMCFSNINYYVDVPFELKGQGLQEEKLQLLVSVTGAFRPGILTALVGVSGAGKTTLMDVLAGRKTGGHIEGRMYISGYPKNQKTFARVSGYCEQNDVHSPCLTVRESLVYSAWLRLSSQCDFAIQRTFVDEVMALVELTQLRGALVGVPGVKGLSVEQRKRLTIAVELVANPSIVFMDEPTSGLDARSAAIVMRAVRNIVDAGRTIVCTIHQPSIDIFESFDELLLMKRGGRLIYAGPLGDKSIKVIDYFEAIPGVQKIRPGYNPAAWILKVTSPAEENRLSLDFAEIYRQSDLNKQNKILVESLSKPDKDTTELNFPSKYSLSFFGQFLACVWKQNLSYWRNPQYTAVRFFYTVIISLMFGSICWKFGSKRETQQDISNAMGSMYAAVLFIGITNATSVQPVVYVERFVSYRERAAGMYSALPFALAQARPSPCPLVAVEFPYVCTQSIIYSTIFYLMASFEWNVWKFLWYIFFMNFTLLYFTFFGMMTISITPNHNVVAIVAVPFYMMWNLFSGFMVKDSDMVEMVLLGEPDRMESVWTANISIWRQSDPVRLSDGVNTLPVKQLLKDQYGFRHDFLTLAAFVVAGFCAIFAATFAVAIKYLNFQRR
ncbi:hypothetical protein SASPL_153147 [Salvia splendens]|uniref:ABC transporter domain-containing protein n=1 Tax=Salvia splendens TaxID=180675 RepID=A0A8X8W4N4_SALSN|nr:hypothetical protein SASPL_153147 [Salvia splendens]